MEDAGLKGGKLQLAQQKANVGPIEHGNAFWKLYVNTNDIEQQHQAAIDAGYESTSPPTRLDRWPTTIAFVKDPDGYAGELGQGHAWLEGDAETFAGVGQFCVDVSELAATIDEALQVAAAAKRRVPVRLWHRRPLLFAIRLFALRFPRIFVAFFQSRPYISIYSTG